jgi:hypothetical protein
VIARAARSCQEASPRRFSLGIFMGMFRVCSEVWKVWGTAGKIADDRSTGVVLDDGLRRKFIQII